jgi:acetyltransferase
MKPDLQCVAGCSEGAGGDLLYHACISLYDGSVATIRPIEPADEPAMVAFHQSLSDESVERRYYYHMKLDQRIAHDRLAKSCQCTEEDVALVADRLSPATGKHEIIGVGRIWLTGAHEAEVALVVADRWQHFHVGTRIMRGLLRVAARKGLHRVHATIMADNIEMHRLCAHYGFTIPFIGTLPVIASKEITDVDRMNDEPSSSRSA